jgi:hypothetical protein
LFSTIIERPVAMIEFSVALAPLRNTGCSHTTRRCPRGSRLARRITTTCIGSAYRRSNRTGSAGRTVNKALFDAVMLSLHLADQEAVLARRDQVVGASERMLEDEDFDALIGRATADRARVFGRIAAFSERLEQLGISTTFRQAVPQA